MKTKGTKNSGQRRGTAAAETSLGLLAVGLACALGYMWFGPAEGAEAGVVAQVGGMTVLSTEVSNEEVVCVLDSRQEQLMVYRADVRDGIQLLQRLQLQTVFQDARAKALGRK